MPSRSIACARSFRSREHVSEIAGSETRRARRCDACATACCRSSRCARCSACRPRPDANSAARSSSLPMGNSSVGVVADRTREILRIDPVGRRPGAGPAHARRGRRGNRIDLSPGRRQTSRRGAVAGSPVSLRARAPGALRSRATTTRRARWRNIKWPMSSSLSSGSATGIRPSDRGGRRDRAAARPDHPHAQGAGLHRRRHRPARLRPAGRGPAPALRPRVGGTGGRPGAFSYLSVGGGQAGFHGRRRLGSADGRRRRDPARRPELSPEQMRLIGRVVANLRGTGPDDPAGRPGATARPKANANMLAKFDRSRLRAGAERFVIKLLIVDDSALMRKLLEGIFLAEGDFDVRLARDRHRSPRACALFRSPGRDARRPDAGHGRLGLPQPDHAGSASARGDDLRADRRRARRRPSRRSSSERSISSPSPSGTVSLEVDRLRPILVEKVRAAAQARIRRTLRLRERIRHQFRGAARRRRARPAAAPPRARLARRREPRALVLIGTSTGGPVALDIVLPQLPAGFPLARDGGPAHAGELHRPVRQTARPAMRAAGRRGGPADAAAGRNGPYRPRRRRSGRRAPVGRPDRDVGPGTTRLSVASERRTPGDAPRSITLIATRLIGVLLTGMGRDGTDAMTRLHKQGGHTIAEAESTAVVWGMPGELVQERRRRIRSSRSTMSPAT